MSYRSFFNKCSDCYVCFVKLHVSFIVFQFKGMPHHDCDPRDVTKKAPTPLLYRGFLAEPVSAALLIYFLLLLQK